MRAYLAIFKVRFLQLIQYRTAAVAAICTNFLFGLVRVMILCAFYAGGAPSGGLTLSQSITYTCMGQILLSMLAWNADGDLAGMIRTGNVAYELLRPMDLYNHWYARAVALRTAPTLLRAGPLVIVYAFLVPMQYRMSGPASPAHFFCWLACTLAALLLSCAVTNLITILTLYTVSGEGWMRILPPIVTLTSGMIIPIGLLPDWLQVVFRALPFAGLVDTPLNFFIGALDPGQLPGQLLQQLFWTAALVLLGRRLLAGRMKRWVVLGG